ncbi:MAG: hypothetical protein LBJ67_08570 [Planctomycetaceae bacterium]|jgi:hypothetical protein|nr:hypothetical protein [Planctomycetaceae bacterium]
MLLDFTFSNYKSVNEKITLSMECIQKLKGEDIDRTNVTITESNGNILKSAVIYGAIEHAHTTSGVANKRYPK